MDASGIMETGSAEKQPAEDYSDPATAGKPGKDQNPSLFFFPDSALEQAMP
jgi:hypothetical protein